MGQMLCQAALWPNHWRASASSVVVNWTAHTKPAIDTEEAMRALRTLIEMPETRVRSLQAGVVEAARRTYYRGMLGRAGDRDATDYLVDVLLALGDV